MLQDYTTYIDQDPNNRFQNVLATSFDVVGMTRNEDAWKYKDFGAGFFGELPDGIEFEIEPTLMNANTLVYSFGISNNIDDVKGHRDNSYNSIWAGVQRTAAGQRRLLLQSEGSVQSADVFNFTTLIRFYCTFFRNGANPTLEIYSDAARTNLLDILSVSGVFLDTFRHMYVCDSFNAGDSSQPVNVSIANHNIVTANVPGYYRQLIESNRRGRN